MFLHTIIKGVKNNQMLVSSFSSPYFEVHSEQQQQFISEMSMHYDKGRKKYFSKDFTLDTYKEGASLLNKKVSETRTFVEKEIDQICKILKERKEKDDL